MSAADRHLADRDPIRLLAGVIATVNTSARTATATVRGWDGGVERHGPCPYMPHPEGGEAAVTHPSRGTTCLLAEDDTGALWIIGWRYS